MNKIYEVIREQPEEVQVAMRQLASVARDPSSTPLERIEAALQLGDIGGPLMMEAIRRECKAALEPRYEYRFVRGAKVKVRVN